MSGFEFIQFEGPEDVSKSEKRRHVRAHVMRKFHRQRRIKQVMQFQQAYITSHGASLEGPLPPDDQPNIALSKQKPLPTSPIRNKEKATQKVSCTIQGETNWADSTVKCSEDMVRPICYSSDGHRHAIPSMIGRSSDPRAMLSQKQYYHALIDQHVAFIEFGFDTLDKNHRQTPFKTYWLPACMVHPMLYHASVFVCAASLETLTQTPLSATSYGHRGKAIQLVNEGLSDPIQRKSDEIIAAIITLANFECVIGNISALQSHLDGLVQLAKLRGGLHQLGMGGLLNRLIKLYLIFLDIYAPLYKRVPRSSAKDPCIEIPSFLQLFTLLNSDVTIPSEYLRLTPILRKLYESIDGKTNRSLTFSEHSDDPSHESLTKIESWPESTKWIYESFRLSYLIWLSGSNYTTDSTLSMLYHLQHALEQTDLAYYWLPLPGALLWCLLVAIDRTYGDDKLYPWFVSQLLRLWVPLSLQRWGGLQRSLHYFGWLLKRGRCGNYSNTTS
ncbi:hypothetical protein F5884DRAFT_806433 [Xylogone sp. PMI_703]|nr:hypothetical protein F5884DRAFT_806433 [Xylogone sp. PMI_703]